MPAVNTKPNSLSEDELRATLAAQSGINKDSTPPETVPTKTAQPITSTSVAVTQTLTQSSTLIPQGQEYEHPGEFYNYYAKPGDTLIALGKRFNVEPTQITSPQPIPSAAFIQPGQLLKIPNTLEETLPPHLLLPDSETINSPSVIDFNINEYINQANGYLSNYEEMVYGELMTGAEIVERVSAEASVNPRFLLAFLDYRSNWVTGQPGNTKPIEHPIGFRVPDYQGLYLELVLAANHLNAGYYGWRSGNVTEAKFPDRSKIRFNPTPNAGTIALQYLTAKFYHRDRWEEVLYGEDSFTEAYIDMFGDPWERASQTEPLMAIDISQPPLELPFSSGERWSLTGGPHYSWNSGSPRGSVDFAPVTGEPACTVSKSWVTASAPGEIIRAADNVVAIDLDEDGHEQTGWVIVYVHIAEEGMIEPGVKVNEGDPIGHPSCERGKNTGTHVHIGRKYNGEWLFIEGPIPFFLSGWEIHAEERNYQGYMTKEGEIVYANPGGNQTSIIVR